MAAADSCCVGQERSVSAAPAAPRTAFRLPGLRLAYRGFDKRRAQRDTDTDFYTSLGEAL